jgi:hypothetical protein
MLTQHNRATAADTERMRGGHDSEADERYIRIKSRAEQAMLRNFAQIETEAALAA